MPKITLKSIVLDPNEPLEIILHKHGRITTKKSGKDLLIFEEGNDTPLAIYENYESVASNIDLSLFPHFAEATTTTAAAVVSDATATAVVAEGGLPTWAYIAGGVGILGGGVALAGGGGGSSSTPSAPVADTTTPVFTSSSTATAKDENSGAAQVIYSATATDASAIVYSLKNTGDASLFSINGSSGAVTLTANPNYETKPNYSFTVIATDSAGNATEQAVSLNINDLDENAPVFTSSTTATIAENVTTTTAAYTATATDASLPLAYTISGTDAGLFNLNVTTGEVKFNASSNYEVPTDNGANNVYDFTIRATDTAGNYSDQNVALTVTDVSEYISPAGQSVIDLGSYGKLIAPVQVDGKWYYYWDRSGDGTSANTGSLNGGVDYTSHNVLDELFNYDINGTINTTVANFDGAYGTTNDYRYATLNSVHLALPTTGNGNSYVTQDYYFMGDNVIYTDLSEIWDTYNTGYQTTGKPAGWESNGYWSATPSTNGHAYVDLMGGYVYNDYDGGSYGDSVALQVL